MTPSSKPTQNWGVGGPDNSVMITTSPYDFTGLMSDPVFLANPAVQKIIHSAIVQNNWEVPSSLPWNTPEARLTGIQDRQKMINDYYAEQESKASLANDAANKFTVDDYKATIDALNEGLKSDVRDLTNESASRGSFGSTAYKERLNSLANQYNTKYGTAFNVASYGAFGQGQRAQEALGLNTPTTAFTKFGANVRDNTVSPVAGADYKYNPFKQKTGTLARDRSYQNYNLAF